MTDNHSQSANLFSQGKSLKEGRSNWKIVGDYERKTERREYFAITEWHFEEIKTQTRTAICDQIIRNNDRVHAHGIGIMQLPDVISYVYLSLFVRLGRLHFLPFFSSLLVSSAFQITANSIRCTQTHTETLCTHSSLYVFGYFDERYYVCAVFSAVGNAFSCYSIHICDTTYFNQPVAGQ